MNDLWLYSLLPFFSAAVGLYLLKRLIDKKSPVESLLLFINIVLVNAVQSIGYIVWPYIETGHQYFADAYLIALYFLFAHLLLFSISLSGKSARYQYRYLIYIFPVILTLLHIAGFMVEGYRIDGYVILHNDGELAWCLDFFVLMSCIAAATIFGKNMKANFHDKVLASKNIIALVSFIPLILAFTVVDLLSRTLYVVPIIVIGPLVTLYAALSFYYLHKERVIYLSVGLVFFMSRLKLANKILELNNTRADVRTYTKAVEKQIILEVLGRHQGKIQEAADYLGMNHTTLRNKIKEYDVITERKGFGTGVGL